MALNLLRLSSTIAINFVLLLAVHALRTHIWLLLRLRSARCCLAIPRYSVADRAQTRLPLLVVLQVSHFRA